MEERQQKAEELRLQLQEDKANRLRDLHVRVEEVKRKREEIMERKWLHLENLKEKMKKAENNRQNHISDIVHRSKEENQKVCLAQMTVVKTHTEYISDNRNSFYQLT